MARNTMMTYPLDQPSVLAQGFALRESDAPGNAKWLALPPESPERAAKGDLSMSHIANFEPRPLTTPGVPYVLR